MRVCINPSRIITNPTVTEISNQKSFPKIILHGADEIDLWPASGFPHILPLKTMQPRRTETKKTDRWSPRHRRAQSLHR